VGLIERQESGVTSDPPHEPLDAIIIGSGAAGSSMAAHLAEGGKRVLILEAGPARTAADLDSVRTTGEMDRAARAGGRA
jgi:choline dehydrogenase-like flavoprotein